MSLSSLKSNRVLTKGSLSGLVILTLLTLTSLSSVFAATTSVDTSGTISDPASGDGLSADPGMDSTLSTDASITPTDTSTDVSASTDVTANDPTAEQQSSTMNFKDVAASHPYGAAIQWATDANIVQGYPDGSFKPDNVVNRAEFLKILLGAENVDLSSAASMQIGFNDVDASAWYAPYVRYAKAHAIVQGYADGSFKPNQPVNFAEGLKIAYNTLGIQTKATAGAWYDQYLQHAKTNGVLYANTVNVAQGMKRKDVVWITWKLMSHQGAWQGQ